MFSNPFFGRSEAKQYSLSKNMKKNDAPPSKKISSISRAASEDLGSCPNTGWLGKPRLKLTISQQRLNLTIGTLVAF